MIHHISVTGLHASLIVNRRQYNHFISLLPDVPVYCLIFLTPVHRLVFTWDYQRQLDIRMYASGQDDPFCCQRIKSKGSAAQKPPVTVLISFGYGLINQQRKGIPFILQQMPMSGKTSCFCLHESILSTARNASLGT